MNEEQSPEKLESSDPKEPALRSESQEPAQRKFELVDYETFAAGGDMDAEADASDPSDASEVQEAKTKEDAEDKPAVDFSPSGRLIWTWESAPEADAPDDTAEEAKEDEGGQEAPGGEADDSEKKAKKSARAKKKVRVEPTPEAAYKFYTKSVKKTGGRAPVSTALCIPAVYLTLASVYGWWLPGFVESSLNYLLAGLLVLQLIVCYDVLLRVFYDLSCGKLRSEGLVLITALVTAADALTNQSGIPYCAVPMLGLCFGLWSLCQRNAAMRRSVKILTTAQEPSCVITAENHWNNLNCTVQTNRPLDGFILDLEDTDLAQAVMGIYAPIAVACALLLAVIASLHSGSSFLCVASAILCGATPVAGVICFSRPFATLAKNLSHSSAALCGWTGALACDGTDAVIVTDQDLFPEGSVTQSGVKVYNDYSPSQVVSYAATVLAQDGGRLYDAVLPLLENLHGQTYDCGDYRTYEGGGLGAEVRSNIILVGSMSFMRLMGVPLPDGAAVRQAVYVSINAELAGIIAIHYEAAPSVRAALQILLDCRGLKTVLATRDFLITPAFVKQCFRLKSNRFVYPSMADRSLLAQKAPASRELRAAVLSGPGLRSLARTLIGGRQLYNLTRINLGCCLAAGLLGLLLLFYLTFTGAVYSLNPANVLLYAAVWALPPLLISRWAGEK